MEREKLPLVASEGRREAPSKVASVEGEAPRDVTQYRAGAEPEPGAEAGASAPAERGGANPPNDVTHSVLPPARWGHPQRPLLLTAPQHEELVTSAEAITQRLLVTDNYDSVSNFISLYDAFDKNSTETLSQLFKTYSPPIRPKKHTCVGLGLELIRRLQTLDKQFPGFGAAVTLVSCEEAVVKIKEYVNYGKGPEDVVYAEKEHVMVGAHIRVDGRVGLLLADPGYHVSRIVTVMADRAYPHTGWFTQSDEPHCRKEFSYTFNPLNPAYVEWHERETRGTILKCQTSLVYVARPYLDGVNVTERRNLVYNFRSLLSRNQKGHLMAGLYFPVEARGKDALFTLFYKSGNEKRRTKHKFSSFNDPNCIPGALAEDVYLCNAQMNYKEGELLAILLKLSEVMANDCFIEQLVEINDRINNMTT